MIPRLTAEVIVADSADPRRRSGLRTRLHAYTLLGPLVLLLLLWVWLFYQTLELSTGPTGRDFGSDTGMFLGAAQVLRDGGNPYDHALVYRAEQELLRSEGLPGHAGSGIVRVGNPPFFVWAFQPLLHARFRVAVYLWSLLMCLLSALGLWATLRFLGWRRWVLPTIVFLLVPQAVLGPYFGNPISVVFAAVGCSLLLLDRQPRLAGVILSLVWLKPQVGLSVVLLLFLFHAVQRRRFIAGFAAGTGLLLAASVVGDGAVGLVNWVGGLAGYSRDIMVQPDISSLAGLYFRWAPLSLRLGLEVLAAGTACALTAATWWKLRGSRPSPIMVAWLWPLWFLAMPYAHVDDEIVLAMPLLALLGRDGRRMTRLLPIITLYAIYSTLILWKWVAAEPFLPVPIAVMALCLWLAGRRMRSEPGGPHPLLPRSTPEDGESVTI